MDPTFVRHVVFIYRGLYYLLQETAEDTEQLVSFVSISEP